jgi:hypothetical protein
VHIKFEQEVTSSAQLPEADLIAACDGVHSRTRLESGGFRTDVRLGSNKYLWLGTDKVFDAFTWPPSSGSAGRCCFHGLPRSSSAGCSKFRTKVPPCASSANTRDRWPWPFTVGARWPGGGYPALEPLTRSGPAPALTDRPRGSPPRRGSSPGPRRDRRSRRRLR